MARNNMNFSASLRLNTKDFKKGVADVQRSLKSLQNSFLSLAGALGLGMSLNRLGSSIKDTAVKLSVAKNTLENVSQGVREYGESLEWLRKISNDYGQDMIVLTNSFAQYRAAAAATSLSIEQLRDIYESLTRAAGAYHMSADRTNDMMIAVTQMFSKGKVTAEELRRQLGNSLPGAFNLMTEAAYRAGVITSNTTAALEDAMRAGKVVSEKVMPEFAKVIQEVTATANFDSLQTSLNRLKNSFTEFVESQGFEKLYKTIVDGANGVLQFFSTSFLPKLVAGIAAVLGSTVIPQKFGKFTKMVNDEAATIEKSFSQVQKTISKTSAEINEFNKAKGDWIETDVTKNSKGFKFVDAHAMRDAIDDTAEFGRTLDGATKKAIAFNNAVLERNRLFKATGKKGFLTKSDIKEIENANREMQANLDALRGYPHTANKASAAFSALGKAAKTAGLMIKSALSSLAIGAIIGGITLLVGKFIEFRKEVKRVNNMVEDTVKGISNITVESNSILVKIRGIRDALEQMDKSGEMGGRKELIDEINKALGRTGNEMFTIASNIKEQVLPAIDDWMEKQLELIRQQAILKNLLDLQTKKINLELDNAKKQADPNYGKMNDPGKPRPVTTMGGYAPHVEVEAQHGLTNSARKLQDSIDENNGEIKKIDESIKTLIKMAKEDTMREFYGIGSGTTGNQGPQGGGGGGGKKADTPQSVLNDYKAALKKLDNQFKAGALSAYDYEQEVKKLNEKTFLELASFGWDNAIAKIQGRSNKDLAEGIKTSVVNAMLEALDDPSIIAEYDKSMEEEGDKIASESAKAWSQGWKDFLKKRKDAPKMEERDTSRDYLYSKRKRPGQTYTEYEEHLMTEDLAQDEKLIKDLDGYIEQLKKDLETNTDPEALERINEILSQMIEKLDILKGSAAGLQQKLDIAKLEKEIADLKKQGLDSLFTDMTSLADATDRLYRAYQSVMQLNDKNWKDEQLEEFLTKLNAVIQVLETLKTIYTALQATEEIYQKIKEKNAAKNIALNGAEAASEQVKAKATAGGALTKVAESVAGTPGIGPALAIAAVGALAAVLLGAMSKFAKGGIVGGNSYSGDNNIVRANSGELILTRGQQAHLWNMINGKENSAGSGQVEFKIRGADLVGTLRNYGRMVK